MCNWNTQWLHRLQCFDRFPVLVGSACSLQLARDATHHFTQCFRLSIFSLSRRFLHHSILFCVRLKCTANASVIYALQMCDRMTLGNIQFLSSALRHLFSALELAGDGIVLFDAWKSKSNAFLVAFNIFARIFKGTQGNIDFASINTCVEREQYRRFTWWKFVLPEHFHSYANTSTCKIFICMGTCFTVKWCCWWWW